MLKQYIFKIKHDAGKFTLKTTASSYKQALKQICNIEGCPESALSFASVTIIK